ncbi:F1F0 ATP synthase subunit delta, mitochondrial [Komagataella phaffii CBS 7435]|uniref:ATP synthase subunit delta, mitochondrial n=2 Tax=Komagataella phaffii TaxID=460519 RepID=C4QYH3_KOMPG|nr:Delta subunit of the central stalk of mitochondrial F1F0 ATP synthase [Komagataella phaffii GS115]AOA61021.1 GQ67_01712T0 [Komagataella phaffii]KAI0464341.1 delta subunit of the central stalk of mitochondrial F1F0 ATP synthase, atp16 [Komagataella kurtzmanii]CAH2447119.1 F1F0 ATP synthase subunit delta, mitochondrial [Komagataella phaffii CBS 7435]AOA66260.1 GQ68_01727T0 [Komagataella phaffii GS115]CAY68296.1 Delta subunit of the central stalk of mitochondrial F1F0 ATP synthase [Komagataell
MFRQSIRSITRGANLMAKRTYAEAAATSDVLKVSLALPHETIIDNKEAAQVNLPGASGELGVLANHVPIVEELKPGVVEVLDSAGKSDKYFISGGVASIQPNSKLSISTIEAFTLDSFSAEEINRLLAESQKNVSSADEAVAAEAAIEVEVLEALQAVVKK